MDPITATLNAYTETLKFMGIIWESLTEAQQTAIINKWFADQEEWNNFIKRLMKP